jgi:hypothetical protein
MCTDSPELKVTHVCRMCWITKLWDVFDWLVLLMFVWMQQEQNEVLRFAHENSYLPVEYSATFWKVPVAWSHTLFSLFITNWCFVAVSHWDVNAVDSYWSYLENKRTVHDGVSNAAVMFIFHLRIKVRYIAVMISISYEGKGTVRPITGHEGPEREYRYSSTLSLASALDGVGGQRHTPPALPPEKTQYPLYRRLDGPQGWSGWVRKMLHPPGFDPRTAQPVASRYTDWAIPAHDHYLLLWSRTVDWSCR